MAAPIPALLPPPAIAPMPAPMPPPRSPRRAVFFPTITSRRGLLGTGKVLRSGSTEFNHFIEPQFTVVSKGPGQPLVQLYMALNMQFR